MARLLALERQEEEARAEAARTGRSLRQLQEAGIALIGLELEEETYSGSEERLQVVLRRTDRQLLPFHSMRVGARVMVVGRDSGGEESAAGIVLEIGRDRIHIGIDQEPEGDLLHSALAVVITSDDITLKRMGEALETFAGARSGRRAAQARTAILGERALDFDFHIGKVSEYFDASLNQSQRAAVLLALAARDVALVHGPPGTGKTRTLIEVIRQAVARGEKVLACAPANVAVDNMVERLAAAAVPLVRMGHPTRTRIHLREHTFDEQVSRRVDGSVLRSMRADERALESRLSRADRGQRRELKGELAGLRREIRDLHRDARRGVLADAAVVLSTCTGAGDRMLEGRAFDLAVVDEAAQCLEPLSYVPLARAGRWVLAGDHLQLPPLVLSVAATREGLAASLFERIVARPRANEGDPSPVALLDRQYRMHRQIMDFISTGLYEGKLIADESVADARIEGLLPLEVIDTAGAGFDEARDADGDSVENSQEAGIISRHLRETLLETHGLAPTDIAIIAPYAAQVRALRRDLPIEGLEIDTVDAFQGREKDAVLVSLVRSNPEGELGFLREIRRMNVALSRARRHLFVIGDSATLGRHPFYSAFFAHAEAVGGYDSVWSRL